MDRALGPRQPAPAVMDKGFTAAVREAAQVNGRPAPTVRGDAGIGPIVALRIEAGRPAAPIAPLSGEPRDGGPTR
ncbi:hypothetical protein ACGFYF_32440 [Streptomyces lavendulae]|uniref:hypothetical protein n=1 Tax=Streptomyces lavendulae TaxID=1914 RepID=UPI003717149E